MDGFVEIPQAPVCFGFGYATMHYRGEPGLIALKFSGGK
jgi:hypothetical protein